MDLREPGVSELDYTARFKKLYMKLKRGGINKKNAFEHRVDTGNFLQFILSPLADRVFLTQIWQTRAEFIEYMAEVYRLGVENLHSDVTRLSALLQNMDHKSPVRLEHTASDSDVESPKPATSRRSFKSTLEPNEAQIQFSRLELARGVTDPFQMRSFDSSKFEGMLCTNVVYNAHANIVFDEEDAFAEQYPFG